MKLKYLVLIFFGFFIFEIIPSKALARHTYLRVHMESAPKTLDPSRATGTREFQILLAIFEGLTRYDPKTLAPLPGVAERWTVSPDGLHYTFYLRKEAKWSDGKPVTAQDFWNSWEHLLNPKEQAPYASMLFPIKGAEKYANGQLKDPNEIGMKITSPQIFEVFLKEPVSYFLNLTAFSALTPIRKDAFEPHLISNGPFIFQSQSPSEGIVLIPNPFYWGKKEIKLAGIQFRPYVDFRDALKLYGATGIDILADLPHEQVLLSRFRSDFRNGPLLRTDYFIFNCKKSPFDKKEVRQALAYTIQREIITNDVLKRGDLPYGFFVPPGIPGYKNLPPGQTFDPSKGKELLQKAGFGPDKSFSVFQILHTNQQDRTPVADAATEMWKKHLEIEGKSDVQEWSTYLKRREKRTFQISLGAWTGDYVDPNTFLELFVGDNRQNYSGWSNLAYDTLINKAKETLDSAKRNQLFAEAEKILLEEAVVIPVFVKTKTYLIQPYVRGYYPNLLDLHPLRDVYSLRP